MPLSMYHASVPVFQRMLTALSAILAKAAAHAEAQGIDPAELIQARLAPDMIPLSGQIQIASDNAKAPRRGSPAARFPNSRTTRRASRS